MESLRVDRAIQLLREEFVAHIAVNTDEGPYVTPVSFVFTGDRIMFRTRPGARLSALLADPRACVEVSRYDAGSGAWESVIVRGRARRCHDDAAIRQTTAALLHKYRTVLDSPLFASGATPMGDEVVVAVSVDEMSGRTSGSFFGARTRPGRL